MHDFLVALKLLINNNATHTRGDAHASSLLLLLLRALAYVRVPYRAVLVRWPGDAMSPRGLLQVAR